MLHFLFQSLEYGVDEWVFQCEHVDCACVIYNLVFLMASLEWALLLNIWLTFSLGLAPLRFLLACLIV